MIALALRASLVVHLAAFFALAAPWPWWQPPQDRMELSGRRGVITLKASFSLPQPELPPVEFPATDAPVVITPRQAKIQERTYVATSQAYVPLPTDQVENAAEIPSAAVERVPPDAEMDRPVTSASASYVPRSLAAMPQIAGLEQGPDFAGNPPPEFPELARQNGWYGTVLLRLWIDDAGRVTKVRVEESSGYGVLDAAAVRAVQRWQGRPARKNARPVATEELMPVVFRPRLARDAR